MRTAIIAICVVLSAVVLFLSWDNHKPALGQTQQQLQNYQNPTLGVSIQYPSDWELQEESNDKLRFVKQEGFVTADLNVENLEESGTTVSEYANTRVNELQAQRPEFQLISNDPITISNKPAQKVVYTFEREEDGKTNKVMRIWSSNEDKLYTLAYVAELGQYDRYLPSFQRMVDSFRIGNSGSASSATQVQSSDSGGEDSDGNGNCDPSYPDVCIKSPPPNLNCPGVPYKNFKVIGNDPHGFDGDNDGIGCESTNGGRNPPPGKCDRVSYPDSDICIPPYPPDLNCADVPYKNFKVTGSDPHGFDRDNDGIGCDTTIEDTQTPIPLTPTITAPITPITPPVTPLVCDEGDILYEGQCLVDDYDCEDASDFEDPRCAGREAPTLTPDTPVAPTPVPDPDPDDSDQGNQGDDIDTDSGNIDNGNDNGNGDTGDGSSDSDQGSGESFE